MELFVLSLLILDTTDSLFNLGLVLVFNSLPRPFFSLFAGLVADRFSRLRILAVAQTINTLIAVKCIDTHPVRAAQYIFHTCPGHHLHGRHIERLR